MAGFILKLFIFLCLFFIEDLRGQSLEQANLFLMREDYKNAIAELNTIIEKDSNDTQALFKLGFSYQGVNDFPRAVKVLEYAALEAPENISVLLSLAKAYRNSGNYSEAKGTYSNILKLDSLNSTAMINLSALHIELQEFDRAKDLYTELSRHDSTNNYFFRQIGLCLFKLDDLKNAAEYYEKALKLYSSDVNASLDLAFIYFKMEKLDSAFMTLHKVYGLYGEDSRIDKLLGEIYLKSKTYLFAEKYFKRALKNGDSSATVLQKTGIAVYLVGQFNSPPDSEVLAITFTEAKNLLQRSYEKNNKDAMTPLYLGLAYKELRDYKMAIKYIEESLNLAIPPYMSEVYNYLATAYDHNGEYQKALKTYNVALEHNPANKTIYYYMAYIHDKRLSDRETALKYYKRFIEWPDADKFLKAFAETRIDKIKEEQFFRSGSSQLN